MRIVIDTNIVVSATLSRGAPPATILDLCLATEHELLVSEEILEEYGRALRYPRVRSRHGLSEEQLDAQIARFRSFATVVEIERRLEVVRADPSDDKFVDCAVVGGAEYIVSGDDHLLALREYSGIQVVTARMFLEVVRHS